MHEFGKLTTLKKQPGLYSTSKEMLRELLEDHETIIIHLRRSIDDWTQKHRDVGTADLLTGLLTKHETIAWTLRRYLISA